MLNFSTFICKFSYPFQCSFQLYIVDLRFKECIIYLQDSKSVALGLISYMYSQHLKELSLDEQHWRLCMLSYLGFLSATYLSQLAGAFLAPQIEGAINRFQVDMSPYPTLARLHEAYSSHPAFIAAYPKNQPDAPSF